MGKVVILDLDGNLKQGVAVSLEIREDDAHIQSRARGRLPPCLQLEEAYQQWQTAYRQLAYVFRLEERSGPVTNRSATEIIDLVRKNSQILAAELNKWLQSESFRPVWEQLLEKLVSRDTIRLILQVEPLTLQRLPWHLWDFFNRYPLAELALSAPAYERAIATYPNREKKRILAILGGSGGIDLEGDRQLLNNLSQEAEIVFLVEPQRRELYQRLWEEEGWDILFFAGHSRSEVDGRSGQIDINPEESLTIEQLGNALKKAIKQGLHLAIFNSCDGLGLARQLETLHLPQIIVMRELVPDLVAQEFLRYFLTSLCQGNPFYLAVREARERLQELEDICPAATWLPVIYQNPTTAPLTWPATSPELPECPYLGLAAFREANAEFFFGRETFTQRLLQATQTKPLVAVIGPSGSGKSSVVFAGLLPKLRHFDKDGENWLITSFRPGNRPFFYLAEQLVPYLAPELGETEQLLEINKLATAWQQGLMQLGDVVARILAKQSQRERFLLVVDQFEELYTLTNADLKATLQQFLEQLLRAIEHQPAFTCVLTLRADFLEYALAYRPWAEALYQYSPELLGPMNREELQAVVEKPALKLGVQIAPGLTERILDAVGEEPGNLPLLEFALTLLWEQQERGCLTHTAYDAIGGVEKALASYAEQVYASLTSQQQTQVRRIFTQLVQPGEGTADTRRVASRTEVGTQVWPLVRYLADTRLVITNQEEALGEETVEVVHEALIREWQRLRGWLEEDRRFRIWQERLRLTLKQWQESDQDEGFLLQGTPLAEAETWLQQEEEQLSSQEKAFIGASRGRQQQSQRLKLRKSKRLIAILVAGAVSGFLLSGLATWQWWRAEKNAARARLNAMSASAAELLASNKELEALMEGLKVAQQLQQSPDMAADTRLKAIATLQEIVYNIREYNRLEAHDRTVLSVSHSPDGELIAFAGDDHTIKLWRKDGKLLQTLEGHRGSIRSLAWSTDGRFLASTGYDHEVKIWTREGSLQTTLQSQQEKLNRVTWSRDGQTVALAGSEGQVELWSVTNESLQLSIDAHQSWVTDVVFSPDGQLLASAGTDKTLKLWRLDGTLAATLSGHEGSVNSVSFSRDGQLIASASTDQMVKLWQVGDGSLLQTLSGHDAKVWDVQFSADGQLLASGSADKTIQLWQLKEEGLGVKLLETLEEHNSSIYSLSFSPDGETLASASADTTVKLWYPPQKGCQHCFSGHEASVETIAISPDGQTLASASRDGIVKLWSLDTPPESPSLSFPAHKKAIPQLTWLQSEQLLASISEDGTVKLWREGELERILTTQTSLNDISFHAEGQRLAVATEDGTVKVWQLSSNKSPQNLRGHKEAATAVSFSPDGQLLATGSDDETIKLWDRDGELVATLVGHTSDVWTLAWSPDGETVASGSGDGSIRLWELEAILGRTDTATSQKILRGHSNQVRSIAWSPNGEALVSGSDDEMVKLWNRNGILLKTLQGHKGEVKSVSFTADGQGIISAGADHQIIVWDLNLQQLLDQGCSWLGDYLLKSQALEEGDARGKGQLRNFCQSAKGKGVISLDSAFSYKLRYKLNLIPHQNYPIPFSSLMP